MSKLRAFIAYSKTTNEVVPMSLVRLKNFPRSNGYNWVEIGSTQCCSPDFPPTEVTSGKSPLMAFMFVSGNGEVLEGPVLRLNYPKNRNFIRVKENLCCDTEEEI